MICRIPILVGILLAQPVWADRVALVIGIADYEHVAPLANPLNDAKDIGDALDRLGFEVTRLEDTSHQEMTKGLNAFRRNALGAELAVVFYAGHGIEVDKNNFLIPVDASLQTDKDIEYEAIPLDLVTRALEDVKGLGLVILDACRDNPFAKRMEKTGGRRSVGRGLARVVPSGNNMVIAYAATEGTTASDGDGTERNSPYTQALLSHLEKPGLEVGFLFRDVNDSVRKSTKNRQEPVYYGSFPKERIFLAGQSDKPEKLPSPPPDPPNPHILIEITFWESIRDSENPSDFESYLNQFRDGRFVTLANGRLSSLIKSRGETKGEDLRDKYGSEAMHYAARGNDIDVLRWLKAKGADINAPDNHGETPMHFAARKNAVDALKWLKAQGADINVWDNNGETLMHEAAWKNAVDAMDWLKAQGADINALDSYGQTPMYNAAWGNAVDALKWLKAEGADINAQDSYGQTPMHIAAWGNAVDALKWLKANGANINAQDNNGETPMKKVARENRLEALEWLRANGGRE